MENMTRRKEVAVAAAMPLFTTTVVAFAKSVGVDIIAAFIAGAGAAVTVRFVIIANIKIERARKKK